MNIDKIELRLLQPTDFEALRRIMERVYNNLPNSTWKKHQIEQLITLFPEGQVCITVDDKLVACALCLRVDEGLAESNHNYAKVTGDFTFNTHKANGTVLYGIDVFIDPDFRGMRLGRRLYDYRKDLCEKLNMKSILFGGRLPNYHRYSDEFTPKEYINKVRLKEIHDPVLNFQLSNDFHVKKILRNYLSGDAESKEYAALLEWNNIYYEGVQDSTSDLATEKTIVRLGLVQWQMRPYANLDDLMEQAEYFIDAVSDYRSDFVLFPEFFNAPLMAAYNHLTEPESIRNLAEFTDEIRNRFSELAISYNINIITGSMPKIVDENLYNIGYLCKRNGEVEEYIKIHVTPDEAKVWGMIGGDAIRVFDTDCGKIGILICYDVEFPELARIQADMGMNILFVPFLTDTQNGYSRVRNCAQARAIENECYVAIAGSVGNLPKVHNMDIQFAQSMVFTPCDFAFPTNGIKAEATPNTEMILISDVDLDLLKELHTKGAVRNLKDRRKDLYSLKLRS